MWLNFVLFVIQRKAKCLLIRTTTFGTDLYAVKLCPLNNSKIKLSVCLLGHVGVN